MFTIACNTKQKQQKRTVKKILLTETLRRVEGEKACGKLNFNQLKLLHNSIMSSKTFCDLNFSYGYDKRKIKLTVKNSQSFSLKSLCG